MPSISATSAGKSCGVTLLASSRVMSRTLPTKRVRRSASSCTVASSSSRVGSSKFGQNFRKLVMEPMMEASGVFRSCEIEVSSAERMRSVSPVTCASSMPAAERDALDRDRRLVRQRIEQAPLVGRQQRGLLTCHWAVEPHDADQPALGPQRQEQPLGAGQRVRGTPRRLAAAPAPFGGGEIGLVQFVLRRIADAHLQIAAIRQQQHHMRLQHQPRSGARPPTADRPCCRCRRSCG